MDWVMDVSVSYFFALLATAATVAWALRGGRRAPEGAEIGWTIILLGWWVMFYLLIVALR
jgi:hypothetical protein